MIKKYSEKVYLDGINFLRKNDPIMCKIIDDLGVINFSPNFNHFEVLVNSILSQQLSTKSYTSIKNKVLDKILVLSPENIMKVDEIEMLNCGVSSNKLSYIKQISVLVIEKKLNFKKFDFLGNEEIIHELIKIKGIGIWTSKMFLIFSLGRMNVLPFEDVGLQNSIRRFYSLEEKPSEEIFTKLGSKWGEFSSISSLYLWRGLDDKVE